MCLKNNFIKLNMIIKTILSRIKGDIKKGGSDINANALNTSKPQKVIKENKDDEEGDTNFINGLEIFFTESGVCDNKKIKILQNEEGSSAENFKNPEKKNKSRDDEIYSDFTDKPFIVKKDSTKEDVEEFKITPIIDMETGKSDITINKSKKVKKAYSRGF